MSISVSASTSVAAPQRVLRPTFIGTLKGELIKISRQRTLWVMSIVLVGFMCVPYLFYFLRPGLLDAVRGDPLTLIYNLTQTSLSIVRVFGGFYLLILAALVVGLEYQQGTIRILLARGVGKLQLLGAKVLAIVIVALAIVVADLIVQAILTPSFLAVTVGSLNGLSTLNAKFWSDSWLYLVTLIISMGATVLLGVAVTVVGRSLAFGLGVGLSWFAADNIGTVMLLVMSEFTHSDFWLKVSAYLLGPLLNLLPGLVVPSRLIQVGAKSVAKQAATVGMRPLVSVTETNALLAILAYSVVFAVVAVVLTWRRDVLE